MLGLNPPFLSVNLFETQVPSMEMGGNIVILQVREGLSKKCLAHSRLLICVSFLPS